MNSRQPKMEKSKPEAPEAPTEQTVPLSRLAQRSIQQAGASFDAEVSAILQMEAQDRGIPETAQFDPKRGVFVIPADPPAIQEVK